MAAPFGDGSYRASRRRRYLFNRGVHGGFDRAQRRHRSVHPPLLHPGRERAAPATINAEIEAAARAGGWKTCSSTASPAAATAPTSRSRIGEFVTAVEPRKPLGDVWIDSVVNVGAYWRAQKLFAADHADDAGKSKTWTWTLRRTSRPASTCA